MRADAFVPPAPPVPDKAPGSLGILNALRTNVLRMFPTEAYRAPHMTLHAMGKPIVLINEPEAIRRVFIENDSNYVRSPMRVRILRPVVGEGLLLAEGDFWRHSRRTAAPAFAPRALPIMCRHFAAGAAEFARRLVAQADGPVDFDDVGRRWTIELSGIAMFSLEMSEFGPQMHALMTEYLGHLARPFMLDVLLPVSIPSPHDILRRRISAKWMAMLEQAIGQRLATQGEGDSSAPRDLLDLLRQARDPETGEGFTPIQLRDQVATMLVAGHETTTSAIFWTLYLLALHPRLQDVIAEEAAGIDMSPENGAQAFNALTATRAILSESMRIFPPVFMIVRQAVAADRAGTAVIPKGATVLAAPWVLHRHESYWQDPLVFDERRFMPDASRPKQYSYLPFGTGPRICIGAQFATAMAVLILANVCRAVRISVAGTRPVLPVCVATTHPDHAPEFRITPRVAPARVMADAPAAGRGSAG